jgi:hypothetical protein
VVVEIIQINGDSLDNVRQERSRTFRRGENLRDKIDDRLL